ncbi:hypothetical protein [Pedobacter sp.]|uniref:hypothetical protein n=1 Tax=Pedobacter sp. TaxID=1411316 RepID=UPI00396CF3E3
MERGLPKNDKYRRGGENTFRFWAELCRGRPEDKSDGAFGQPELPVDVQGQKGQHPCGVGPSGARPGLALRR